MKAMRTMINYIIKYQLFVLLGLASLSFGLGAFGISEFIENSTRADAAYQSWQLFVLGLDQSVVGDIPIELQIARIVSPAIAASAAIAAFIAVFREQFQLIRLHFYNDHVVICGLGRKGSLFSEQFRKDGRRVVIIEKDPNNERISTCMRSGSIVFAGSAKDSEMLKKAKVHKAGTILAVCGDDGTNAEIAGMARELAEAKKRRPDCFIHINDPQLCKLLRDQEYGADGTVPVRDTYYNIFESGAQSLLRKYPRFGIEDENVKDFHILLVGLGRFGQSVLMQAAKNWKREFDENGEKIHFTVVDRNAEEIIKSINLRDSRIKDVCTIKTLQVDIDSHEFEKAAFLYSKEEVVPINSILVCLDDDSRCLSASLKLHGHLTGKDSPIDRDISLILRMTRDKGLAYLLNDDSKLGFKHLHAFGLLTRTCIPDIISLGTNEVLARAIHEEYVEMKKRNVVKKDDKDSVLDWDDLNDDFKYSNRDQAKHIDIKLKAVNCKKMPLTDWDEDLFRFTPEEVEKLARMEHERWNEERKYLGWKYGEKKDVDKKITPYLVPYDKLSEEIKGYDRNTVRELPAFLARTGFKVERV